MCRIFGYSSPEELKNITVSSLYQNSQERKTFLKQIVENNLAKDFELQLKKKDGTPIIASVTASAHRDIKGKIDWIDGVIEDVTERKKAEQKLRSEYDKFQGMLSAMEQGVDIVNKNYIIEFQNNLLKERFGDKQGEKCYVVYMGLKKPCNICMIHKAIGIGKTTRVELVGADGRNYEVNSSPFTDVDGEVKVIELVRDITEHKRAENILRESEEKYRGLVKNVDIGVFRTPAEPQGFFLEVNPAMARIFGYKSSEELMQHSVNDIYENPRARKIVLDKIKKNGFFKNEELRFKKKDGAIIIVSSTAAVHRDKKGKIDWIDGVIEDITERKHAEEELRKHRLHLEEMVQERTKQLKNTNVKLEGELVVHKRLEDEIERHASQLEVANKELDAFAYSVSHDLRAPLRSINGFSTALFEDYSNKLDDQGKNYIARVRTATNRMEQLIDDLLALSRITRSTLQYADADLSRIVKDIVAEFCEREPKRKVKVKISPNITVTGDPELLQIVLFNLLDNAWKFTGKKQNPEIEFGVIEHAKRKTYFVRDNGVGFDMTYVDKLFMPFQRLHGTSEFAGTGIGLATVKRIILRHSGNVWGEGKKGRGATFYFTL
jgi:PAS domain S-box-containing protein